MSKNERIDRLISAILVQSYKNVEIIVVDNFSSDGCVEVCKKSCVKFFQLRSTISEARNLGLEEARGDYVIFLDCDQVPPPNLFEECICLVKQKKVECIVIEIECVPTKIGHFMINCVDMHKLEVDAGIGTTGTRFPLFYSARLAKLHRFPDKVSLGEDFVFALSVLKHKPKIAKAHAKILHYEDPSVKSLVKRSWHYGRAFVSLQKNSGEAFEFINNISVLNSKNLSPLFNLLFLDPGVIFPFTCYLFVKYFSFLMGYLSKKIRFVPLSQSSFCARV